MSNNVYIKLKKFIYVFQSIFKYKFQEKIYEQHAKIKNSSSEECN